ncbi:MAG: hypothetical protein ACRETU_07715 [Steroidobacterales bacterium]
MSARIFFGGAVTGAFVGALAVALLRPEQAARPGPHDTESATTPSIPTPSARPPLVAASTSSVADSVKPIQPAVGAGGTSAPQAGTTTEGTSASPLDPTEEVLQKFARDQSHGPSFEELTDKIKTETRDDAWASYMEAQLSDYLARQPVPNALGSLSIGCRMTVCRVVSLVSDEVVTAVPHRDLQFALFRIPGESLGRDLTVANAIVIVDPKHPGQTIEAFFLQRVAPSDSTQP